MFVVLLLFVGVIVDIVVFEDANALNAGNCKSKSVEIANLFSLCLLFGKHCYCYCCYLCL